MPIDELVSRLDSAYSREDGLEILRENIGLVSDKLAEELTARANELKGAQETVLSADCLAWAAEARSLVTRRLALDAQGNQEAAVEFLRTQRGRLDDAFYDLCFRIASSELHKVYALLQAETPEPGAVEEGLKAVAREMEFLTVVAELTKSPQNRDKTSLLEGTYLLFRSQWEVREGRTADGDKSAAEASRALEAAAGSSVLTAEMRALAEMRLAALAGSSNPEIVKQHQQAALSIAEAGKAWDVASVVRRDLAYWAKQRGDWKTTYELYRQNIELSEREIWAARVIADAATLELQAQPDYEGALEACLELAKSDATFYERALENAEQGKARGFLRGLATVGTVLGNVPPKLKDRWNRILRRMRMPELSSSAGSAMAPDEPRRLSQALETVEEQMWTRPRLWALDMQCAPCSFKEMCALAPSAGVILSYFVLADRLIIFVLGKGGLAAPPVEVPVRKYDLARWNVELQATMYMRGNYEAIDQMQRAIGQRVEAVNAKLYLQQFHKVLIQPVAEHVTGKRQIIVVPHGVLSTVPFHALSDSNDRAVVDDFALSYSAGLSVLRWCQARARIELTTCFAAGVSRTRRRTEVSRSRSGCRSKTIRLPSESRDARSRPEERWKLQCHPLSLP